MSQAEECTEIKLTVPWGHVAAKTYGPSTGKCVLMVHGRQDNAGTFTRLMKYLPIGFYYVCIDLPSHGLSSHFPPGLSVDILQFVNAIYFILEALQWKTCIYIGHSMGGQIGILFSIFQPHRIKKIISIDAILPIPVRNDTIVENLEETFKYVIKASNNMKPPTHTKEEIVHAFKTMRVSALNTDAANALFERGVTKVDGKYVYNRDIRLKSPVSVMNSEQLTEFVSKISIPTYILVAIYGLRKLDSKVIDGLMNTMSKNALCRIIYVDGNHDTHSNTPEKIAPIICQLLNSDNFSKL